MNRLLTLLCIGLAYSLAFTPGILFVVLLGPNLLDSGLLGCVTLILSVFAMGIVTTYFVDKVTDKYLRGNRSAHRPH